jgi:hypothetical protein
MKYVVTLITLCGALLLTSGTVEDTPPIPNYTVKETIIPVIVDMHVAEYPPPVLNINGMMKYHVMINGKVVGMSDNDVQTIVDLFDITPYPGDQFHELGMDSVIWANKRHVGFSDNLTSVGRRR